MQTASEAQRERMLDHIAFYHNLVHQLRLDYESNPHALPAGARLTVYRNAQQVLGQITLLVTTIDLLTDIDQTSTEGS